MYINNFYWHFNTQSGKPGLVDRVLALHAGSPGFDSQRGHMSERFFRSNRPGYLHPVSSELENSGIRVAVSDCSSLNVDGGVRYENWKTHTHFNTQSAKKETR